MTLNLTDLLTRDVAITTANYINELNSMAQRIALTVADAEDRGYVSTHAAHNLASQCQELAVLASRIEQTKRVLGTVSVEAK